MNVRAGPAATSLGQYLRLAERLELPGVHIYLASMERYAGHPTRIHGSAVRPLRRYKRRWIIERSFARLGRFRRLVVRYEYYAVMYLAFLHLACAIIALRRL